MLRVENLTAGYESGFAVRQVNMQVRTGQMFGIIGPNGAGKTTLLRALTRQIVPRQGQVLVDGRDLWSVPLKELARKMAVVSQNVPAGDLDVWGCVLVGRLPHFASFQFRESHSDRQIAEQAMRMAGAWMFRDRLMDELSGGERQLVVIARALAQQPSLLLLDEPIAHLDIGHQLQVLDLLRRLNAELGLTIVMVLHDLNLAAEYCDALVLLDEGRVHKHGPPAEVLTYRTIETVYKTVVVVGRNPVSEKPYVCPVPEAYRATTADDAG
jgi:iron complex transport system ATP-binding protein